VVVLQSFFWVVVLLGVMILIHELGHYWAAVAVGIKVETFSIGFGPRLFGFRRGETDFRISAIFFGGYVRMLGELPGDESTSDPRSFQAKARWQRAVVVVAGPLMNIILAIAIIAGFFMTVGHLKLPDSKNPVITTVEPGSGAAAAGIVPGDHLLSLDGKTDIEDIAFRIIASANRTVVAKVMHEGQTRTVNVQVASDPKQGIGDAGITLSPDVRLYEVEPGSAADKAGLKKGDLILAINHAHVLSVEDVIKQVLETKGHSVDVDFERAHAPQSVMVTPMATGDPKQPWRIGIRFGEFVRPGFFAAVIDSIQVNSRNATLIFDSLRSIVERRISPAALSGPIRIAQESGKAAKEGPGAFLDLMAAVSLNLAIFNLLPIPILDGGTLLMLLIEMLLQREVSMRVKENIFKVGFVFLMMVVVFVIYNDISHILTKS
jgi:regulator of sigma E protease